MVAKGLITQPGRRWQSAPAPVLYQDIRTDAMKFSGAP
jgi:hypothetical protein